MISGVERRFVVLALHAVDTTPEFTDSRPAPAKTGRALRNAGTNFFEVCHVRILLALRCRPPVDAEMQLWPRPRWPTTMPRSRPMPPQPPFASAARPRVLAVQQRVHRSHAGQGAVSADAVRRRFIKAVGKGTTPWRPLPACCRWPACRPWRRRNRGAGRPTSRSASSRSPAPRR